MRRASRGPLAAQTIDTIVVENRNIFEPLGGSPRLLARVGDALHVRTRPWVIRRTLLFDQGDRYDSAQVLESERALRGLGVFRNVELDTARVDGRFGAAGRPPPTAGARGRRSASRPRPGT